MIYACYALLALCSLFTDIACKFFLNWIVVVAADSEGNLPRKLRYFQTFDATLDEGMLARRREIMLPYYSDQWKAFNPYPQTWWQRYKNRGLWLFRNTGYGFDYYLFGLKWNPAEWRVLFYEDTEERTLFIAVGPGFNIYYHGPLGMYKLGWKAWNMYSTGTGKLDRVWGDGTHVPITFSLNPFKVKR